MFGGCPSCGGSDYYLNVFKGHFMLCDIHRIYWCFGWNLLSSWQFETRLDWRANLERLMTVSPAETSKNALVRAEEELNDLDEAWDAPLDSDVAIDLMFGEELSPGKGFHERERRGGTAGKCSLSSRWRLAPSTRGTPSPNSWDLTLSGQNCLIDSRRAGPAARYPLSGATTSRLRE